MSNTFQTDNTIKAQYKGHEFLLSAGGRFIKDLTQEALDRDLGSVKERAVHEGRRLYMIDIFSTRKMPVSVKNCRLLMKKSKMRIPD